MAPESEMRGDNPRLRMLCGAGMLVLALVSVLVTWPYILDTPGLNPINLVGIGILETMTVALAVILMTGWAGRKKIRLTLTRSRWRIYNLIGVAAVFLPLTILALGSPRMLPVVGLGPLLVALGLALILEQPRSSAPVGPPTTEQVAASKRLLMPLLVLGAGLLAASIVLGLITGTIEPLMLFPVGVFFLVIGIAIQIAAAKQRKNHQAATRPDTGTVPP